MARVFYVVTLPGPADVLAPGLAPRSQYDLVDHGGKTLPAMSYASFYVGGAGAWTGSDMQSIDNALAAAMTDAALNEIVGQYFDGASPATAPLPSQTLDMHLPHMVDKTAIETAVVKLLTDGMLSALELTRTVVNLMLPPGAVLSDGSAADSLHGLGGYHGSVHSNGQAVYYAAGVYSQRLPDGRDNGIVAFDQPWKNVVATFYHELNEVRTDADVEDAISAGGDQLLGWVSPQGYEIGDEPIFESGGHLSLVFKEVAVHNGAATAPIQLLWSNRVHGPEGP